MSDTTIASLTTILAVLVGGLLNHLASRWTKDREWRQGLQKQQIESRTKLYADFLSGTQRLVAQSIDEKCSNVIQFDILYNEFSRIELIATDDVIKKASDLVDYALELHSESNKEPKASYRDLKLAYISAVKAEIRGLEEA